MRTAFPDISVTVDELVADENRVAARWTRHGTFTSSLTGIPATGTPITVNGLSMFHFNDKGRFIEVWVCFDTLKFQQELAESPIVFGQPTQ